MAYLVNEKELPNEQVAYPRYSPLRCKMRVPSRRYPRARAPPVPHGAADRSRSRKAFQPIYGLLALPGNGGGCAEPSRRSGTITIRWCEETDVMCPTRRPRLLCRPDRLSKVVQYAGHSLRFFGNNPAAHYCMAVCYYQMKDLEHALECIDKALEAGLGSHQFRDMKMLIRSEMGVSR
jgi:hypothetical protein